ncbi:MAG: TonB-dependent receptor [Sphingobium sp.]|uniref:TonB-dependent receptor n=1 Tax=Sphingobium sp. CECT 9361 TaxID=2845384 RepID=UPI001E4B62A6|nr:TonB-dependent receptor [Sphingobium sp. CECT 9361]CAH0349311.1 Metal-pseudopaline receptor CntO [Sphingobium sp. CECT 9361]
MKRSNSIPHIRAVFLTALAGVSAAALCQPAFAQETAPVQAAEEDTGGIDIVVTAQKREENLQNVPLSVSVIGGDAIAAQGGVNLENAQYLVPSLNFRKSGTSLNQALFLRGVGTINFSIAAEPSVAAVIDGVVLSRAGEGFGDLVDIDRVEVLRGPQGTLFGKNASAGVVSMVSKRPEDTLGGTAEASYFDASEYRARATINIPLGDNVRSRFTGFYSEYDGNLRNIALDRKVNGYKHYGVRGAIEADLSDAVTVILRGDWRKANDDCCAEVIGTVPTNAAAAALSGTNISGDETRRVNQNLLTQTKEESWGVSMQIDAELGNQIITSITAYRNWDNTEIRDGDWLDRPYVGLNQLHDIGPQTSKTFSQELRLSSPTGNFFEYVAGLYYSRAESQRQFTRDVITCSATTPVSGLVPCTTGGGFTFTNPFGTTDYGSVFTNMAAFGQVTLNVSDRFRAIGGIRYTADQLDGNILRTTRLAGAGVNGNFDAGVYNNGAGGGVSNGQPVNLKVVNDNWSGKAALQYDITDDTMGYASYTRGYKGPAYNLFFNLNTSGAGVIAPETVDAYEVGLKNSLFGNRLILNLTGFYAKYNNYQANNPDLVAGVVVTRLTNAGTVSTRGVELDMVYQPSRAFTLSGGLAYTDAKVDEFRLPPGATESQRVPNGTRLSNAPKWKGSLGATYKIETGGFANIELGAQGSYQSSQLYELSPNAAVRAATTVKGYGIVDVSAGLVAQDNGWSVRAQVKNLLDQSFASSIVSGGPGGSYRFIIPREADRYFGVTAKVNFGSEK